MKCPSLVADNVTFYCLLSHDSDAVWAVLLPPVSRYRCCTGCVVASCQTVSRHRCCTGWVISTCGDINVTSESRCYELIFLVVLCVTPRDSLDYQLVYECDSHSCLEWQIVTDKFLFILNGAVIFIFCQ